MKAWVRGLWAVLWKDLAVEWRSREVVTAMLVFALLAMFIFNFALELEPRTRREVTAGVLWVSLAFAGTLGLNRSLAAEKDQGCLDGLLLAPVERTAIFFGKMLASLTFMLLTAGILLPLYSGLYGVEGMFRPAFLLVVGLGALGYVAVGTLLASLAVQARTRDILLPILLFPVVLPLLVAAVKASSGLLAGEALASLGGWVNLLVVYDVVFIAVAIMIFQYVVEE